MEGEQTLILNSECENSSMNQMTIDVMKKFIPNDGDYINSMMSNKLLESILSTVGINSDKTTELIQHIQNRYNELPKLYLPSTVEIKEISIPVIKKLKTDTTYIKQLIDKTNMKTQSFLCDHTKHKKNYKLFHSEILKVFNSEEFTVLNRFHKLVVNMITRALNLDEKQLEYHDIEMKTYRKVFDHEFDNMCNADFKFDHGILEEEDIKLIRKYMDKYKSFKNIIMKINQQFIELEGNYQTEKCYKCESMLKYYEQALSIIKDNREEIEDHTPEDEKFCIIKFVEENYSNMNRIPVTDIQRAYKEKFKLSKTQEEIKKTLENTGKFVSKNDTGKFFVKRK